MIRHMICAAILALQALSAQAESPWTRLETYTIGRFDIDLPAGGAWQVGQGDASYGLSRRLNVDGEDLFVWIGFEVDGYPDNRDDWLASEIAREARDFYALGLLDAAQTTGKPLERLDYGETEFGGTTSYWLKWSRQVHIEQLGQDRPEYQEMHLFFPADHARDNSYLALFLGVLCVSDCIKEERDAAFLAPVLATVRMRPAE